VDVDSCADERWMRDEDDVKEGYGVEMGGYVD